MAELRFSYGVMSAGKSTLALQVEHTWTEAGRCGVLLTSHDRGGAGRVTSRLGLGRPAVEVAPHDRPVGAGAAGRARRRASSSPTRRSSTPRRRSTSSRAASTSATSRSPASGCSATSPGACSRAAPGWSRWPTSSCRCRCRCCAGAAGRRGSTPASSTGWSCTRASRSCSATPRAVDGALFGPDVRYEVLCRRHWARREPRGLARSGPAGRRSTPIG